MTRINQGGCLISYLRHPRKSAANFLVLPLPRLCSRLDGLKRVTVAKLWMIDVSLIRPAVARPDLFSRQHLSQIDRAQQTREQRRRDGSFP